jgi:hypothetical protein
MDASLPKARSPRATATRSLTGRATRWWESAGYRDDSWLDILGNFFSSAARVTERIRRPSFSSLDIDATVNDPKVFTKTWTVSLHMKPMLDTEMIDFICMENNKDLTTWCALKKSADDRRHVRHRLLPAGEL